MLSDQLLRERFCTELDTNFSVLAPAGVGKTHAIVRRVVAFARAHAGRQSLIVVTYTRKAAREMEARAQALWKELGHAKPMEGVYFGTIHSFCMDLIERWGHFLGLTDLVEPIVDDWSLWHLFLTNSQAWQDLIAEDFHFALGRLVPLEAILKLARELPQDIFCAPVGPFPALEWEDLLSFVPENKRLLPGVLKGQVLTRDWLERWNQGTQLAEFPITRAGGEDFLECFERTWAPLKDWAANGALNLAQGIAQRYRAYRLARGQITYDDMVHTVRKLLDHPQAAKALQEERYHIILDEAQDTDAAQFDCLLALSAHAQPGRFSMVGDPQQAIYTSRACFTTYRSIHESLITDRRAEELAFEVTFRCGQQVVIAVNECFSCVLDGEDQVDFSRLAFPDGAHEGQVCRIPLPIPAEFDGDALTQEVAAQVATAFAHWLSGQTLDQLRARDYSEVAILCPRADWLSPLAQALEKVGLKAQLRLSQARRTSESYGKIAGLVAVMADPKNSFELVGALWGLMRVPQGDLEEACKRGAFTLENRCEAYPASVQAALRQLRDLHSAAAAEPLSLGLKRVLDSFHLLESNCGQLTLLYAQSIEGLGKGWSDLAQWLARVDPAAKLESQPLTGHVQLITCHGAKGLEWDCVILPFFYRSIPFKNQAYPRLLHSTSLKKTALLLDQMHRCAVLEIAQAQAQEAELERLLYVSATRARHSLIFCDDRAFFKDTEGSFAQLMGATDLESANFAYWNKLPTELTPGGLLREAAKDSGTPLVQVLPMPEWERVCGLGNCAQRLVPSDFEEHSFEDLQRSEGHAIEYGNAWHAMMRDLPFNDSENGWTAHFESHLARFPDEQKARAQWNLFLESELTATLNTAGAHVFTEVPLMVYVGNNQWVDGFVDALVELPDGQWLLVDWKTDSIERSDAAAVLQRRYKAQLELYAQALRSARPEIKLKCAWYATSLGRLVPLN